MTDLITDYVTIDNGQCLPLKLYDVEKTASQQLNEQALGAGRSAITDSALSEFRKQYGKLYLMRRYSITYMAYYIHVSIYKNTGTTF